MTPESGHNRRVSRKDYDKPNRLLNPRLIDSLTSGTLAPIFDAVRDDQELRCDLRPGYLNVYYRGGRILKLGNARAYRDDSGLVRRPSRLEFDPRYFGGQAPAWVLEGSWTIEDACGAQSWVQRIQLLKMGMDMHWATAGERAATETVREREHQQLIADYNDVQPGRLLNDVVIVDIEYQYYDHRFDMVALMRDGENGFVQPRMCLIELKTSATTTTGGAGIPKHAKDYAIFLSEEGGTRYQDFKKEISNLISQKRDSLGLYDTSFRPSSISDKPPIVLFLFSGEYSPSQEKLRRIGIELSSARSNEHVALSELADVRLARMEDPRTPLMASAMRSVRSATEQGLTD